MSEYETVRRGGKVRRVHDVLAEKMIGRPLAEDEVVHHINGDKRDNREENLLVMKREEHARLHQSGVARSPETLERLKRANRGRVSSGRKLNETQVREIAGKLVRGVPLKELSGEYGVSNRTIMSIRDGKTYRDYLKDYPDSVFPLRMPNRRFSKGKRDTRRLTEEGVNAIRLSLWSGEAVDVLAKRYKVSPRVIQMIRDGEIYRDVPWPENIAHMRRVRDVAELAIIFLSEPMSSIQDEYTALREDYCMEPDLYSVTMLRLVRRALMGDAELALLLMTLAGYRGEIDKTMEEESVILQAMQKRSGEG